MTPDALRVLMLTPQLPYPPEQGAALRNLNILKYLGERHTVTLLSFGSLRAVAPELRACCRQVIAVDAPQRRPYHRLATQLLPIPDLAVRLRSPAFGAALANLVRRQQFDIVQCEALELFPYARLAPAPLILDAHNAEWRLQQRAYTAALHDRRPTAALYSLLQWRKLAAYEQAAMRASAQVLTVSSTDQEDLQHLAPDVLMTILPNGVDDALYAPMPVIQEEEATILFGGKMDFRPNVEGATWLAGQVMPLVWQRRPAARLILFGRDPAPAVQRLAADRRITVTGRVPGTAAEVLALARAAVVTVPLFSGGGTRLKILNALAMARPVVSTTLGAAGYDLQDGRDLLLAEGPAAFAEAILRLLNDRPLAGRLGSAGRDLVRRTYTWQRLLPALDRVYAEVVRG